MERVCLTCGEPLVGRSDKKFCTDQCRFSYNNKVKRKNEKLILDINKILRRNRAILKQFNPEGKTTVRSSVLLKVGFDFRYFTHAYKTRNNIDYHFCYEYGYHKIDNTYTLIINWQPYMKPNVYL